jgi:hypothetical protein
MKEGHLRTRRPPRRLRWSGALADARRALSVVWRRSREPALRGAPPTSARAAWTFVGWIVVVGIAYGLMRRVG